MIAVRRDALDMTHPSSLLYEEERRPKRRTLINLSTDSDQVQDDDSIERAAVQAGATANQSLDRTDIIEGGPGNDVVFGLNGDDVIDGGPGQDIILGGPDGERHPAAHRTAT
jgi:RTX calcium-binding nonapeptide repeat (4 copies)